MRFTPRTTARIAICVEFAALIRCIAEYFRLEHALGPAIAFAAVDPFILGALITSVFALAATLFYFAEKFYLTISLAAVNVAVLLILKIKMVL